MSNLSGLVFNLNTQVNWTGTGPTSAFSQPVTNQNNYQKKLSLGTANANATLGGSDELYAALISIGTSGNATINLASFEDIINQTTISLARLKFWRFQLLSVADDSTNGTACTSVTIGGGTDPFVFNWGGTSPANTIYNGGMFEYGDSTAAGFTVASGTNNNIKIVNNDASHTASVVAILVGGTT